MGSIINPNNYPAKKNVLAIISVSLIWIILSINIPDEYLFYTIEGLLFALIITSIIYNNILDIIILAFIGIIMGISFYFVYPDEEYQQFIIFRTAAITSFGMMGFVLSIGPLSRISNMFLDLYKYRRHLGVSVFFLGALHAVQVISFYEMDIYNLISEGDFAAFGIITLSGLGFLSLTSWDYIQKRLPPLFFDIIHLLWTFSVIYIIYLDYQEYGTWNAIEPVVKQWLYPILIIFPVATFRFSIPKFVLKTIMPWKQLHILSWIIFLTMGLHAVTAYDAMVGADKFVIIVWTVIITVLSLHAGVGIIDAVKNRKLKRDSEKEFDGVFYTHIGTVDDFHDCTGQRFDIKGTSIAVFKINDQFHAYSNVCSHQKGPICKSTIEDGYVVCPWHRFQYGVENGEGPPGFKDKIAYYKTIIEDGNIWVSID